MNEGTRLCNKRRPMYITSMIHAPCFAHLFGLSPYRLNIFSDIYINRHRSYVPWWLVACFLRVSCLTIYQCPPLPLHSFNSSSIQKLITCRVNVYPQERKAKSKLLFFVWEPLAPLILEPIIKISSKKFPVGPYGKQLKPVCYRCLNNSFQCLNNIIHIFSHVFSLTSISKKYKQRY